MTSPCVSSASLSDVFPKYLLDQAIFILFPRSTTTHTFVLGRLWALTGTLKTFGYFRTLHTSKSAIPVKRKEHGPWSNLFLYATVRGHILFVTSGPRSTLPPSSSNSLLQLKGQPLCRSEGQLTPNITVVVSFIADQQTCWLGYYQLLK